MKPEIKQVLLVALTIIIVLLVVLATVVSKEQGTLSLNEWT